MEHKKFDQQSQGKYWVNYFKGDKEFYDKIKEHIKKSIPNKETLGLDIGAGPGIGALLIEKIKFKTKLVGFEPSKTSLDGKRLAEEFSKKDAHIKYIAKKGNISEIKVSKTNPLDYLLILRASHEIAESLGGKDKFFKEISRIISGLKNKGILIIAEPQYSKNNVSKEIIKKVQEYQMKNISHCHVPSDYIQKDEMKSQLEKRGLKLINESVIQNNKLLKYLNSNGINIKESPCSFYIQTFQKP